MVRPAAIFVQKNKPACGRFILSVYLLYLLLSFFVFQFINMGAMSVVIINRLFLLAEIFKM